MRLFIEGIEVGTGLNDIAFTKKPYLFSRDGFGDINIAVSKPVQLPDSRKLRRIFTGGTYEIKREVFNKYYNFELKDRNVTVMSGVAMLHSANQTFKVILIDKSKTFFDSLKKSIKQLDFEADDFVFTTAEYNNKKTDNSTVWIWPVVNNFIERKANDLPPNTLKYSRPCLNYRKIADAIFTQNGWNSYICEGLQETNNICITTNHEQFFVTSWQKTVNQTLVVVTTTDLTDLSVNDFEHNVNTGTNFVDVENITTRFRVRGYIEASADFVISFEGVSTPSGDKTTSQMQVRKGRVYYDFTTPEFTTDDSTDNVYIRINGTGDITFESTLFYTVIEEADLGDFNFYEVLNYLVKVHDNMPDISQIEFLRNCWVTFGSFPVLDAFSKSINVFNLNRLAVSEAVDWSAKINKATIKRDGTPQGYGKQSYFRYNNDSTIPQNYGQALLEINDNTLPETAVIYTHPFGASMQTEIDGQVMADIVVYSKTERVNTLNPRILTYEIPAGETYTIATFNEIAGDVILNKYWQKLANAFSIPLYLTAFFNLNRTDYFNFDAKRTVYIKGEGYFVVLSIKDYIEGKETEVELLKIL